MTKIPARRAGYSLGGLLLAVALWSILLSFGISLYQCICPPIVTFLAFTPEGDKLAAGYANGRIEVWETPSGRWAGGLPKGTLRLHGREGIHVKLSSGAKYLLHYTMFGNQGEENVNVYDVSTNRRLASFDSFDPQGAPPVVFIRRGTALLYRQSVSAWNELNLRVTADPPDSIQLRAGGWLVASPSGSHFTASPFGVRALALYRASDYAQVGQLPYPDDRTYVPVAISHGGKQVALVGSDTRPGHETSTIIIWNVESSDVVPTRLNWPSFSFRHRVEIRFRGQQAVATIGDSRVGELYVQILDGTSDAKRVGENVFFDLCALSSDARWLANYEGGRIDIWDLRNEPHRQTLRPARAWQMLYFSAAALLVWVVAWQAIRWRRLNRSLEAITAGSKRPNAYES